jgi:hypothetical protein
VKKVAMEVVRLLKVVMLVNVVKLVEMVRLVKLVGVVRLVNRGVRMVRQHGRVHIIIIDKSNRSTSRVKKSDPSQKS